MYTLFALSLGIIAGTTLGSEDNTRKRKQASVDVANKRPAKQYEKSMKQEREITPRPGRVHEYAQSMEKENAEDQLVEPKSVIAWRTEHYEQSMAVETNENQHDDPELFCDDNRQYDQSRQEVKQLNEFRNVSLSELLTELDSPTQPLTQVNTEMLSLYKSSRLYKTTHENARYIFNGNRQKIDRYLKTLEPLGAAGCALRTKSKHAQRLLKTTQEFPSSLLTAHVIESTKHDLEVSQAELKQTEHEYGILAQTTRRIMCREQDDS